MPTSHGIDPVWLDRQLARFKPSDMDAAVKLMREYDRADRQAAQRAEHDCRCRADAPVDTLLRMSTLGEQFRRQVRYLKTSARLFDEGDEEEAIRLAVTLRVLLHDTTKSHSLLKLAGLKSGMKFLDTAIVGGTEIYAGPVVFQLEYVTDDGETGFAPSGQDGLVEVVPTLDGGGRICAPRRRRGHETLKPFNEWWTTYVIDTASGSKTLSRKQLIWLMANKDGGAHVDPSGPGDVYIGFVKRGHGQLYSEDPDAAFTAPESMRPFEGNAAAESVRQIAWEVLETFDNDPATQAWRAMN
ncbi:hypothetical protein [Nocardia ninae]|nr:hypothetical protein [Nocardia ninae]